MKTSIQLINGQWSITIEKLTPLQLVELINNNKLNVENKESLAPHWRLLLT